jgi:hypothetical protein
MTLLHIILNCDAACFKGSLVALDTVPKDDARHMEAFDASIHVFVPGTDSPLEASDFFGVNLIEAPSAMARQTSGIMA